MLIKRPNDIPSSEITPESLYWNRRRFVGVAGAMTGAALFRGLTPLFPLSTYVERGPGGEVPVNRGTGAAWQPGNQA
ncbi:MAG: hypothetical protein ACREJK_10430, partial [Candidatus Methylomirabilales bacterium]